MLRKQFIVKLDPTLIFDSLFIKLEYLPSMLEFENIGVKDGAGVLKFCNWSLLIQPE